MNNNELLNNESSQLYLHLKVSKIVDTSILQIDSSSFDYLSLLCEEINLATNSTSNHRADDNNNSINANNNYRNCSDINNLAAIFACKNCCCILGLPANFQSTSVCLNFKISSYKYEFHSLPNNNRI